MKMRRPRTLLGMVLMGLAFVTVPLLIAVGNAMIKLGQLAAESEVVLARQRHRDAREPTAREPARRAWSATRAST